jgi:propionyl-CoA carboxylase alpha chain
MWRRLAVQPQLRAALRVNSARPLTSLSALAPSHCRASRFFSTQNVKPFDKVLIANRGEISQRVVKTCKELGIKTVAIYSTADAKAPFVQAADEAICIGPADSSASYLNVERVLQAIRDTGAQAVHPGYGFLSENADFCKSIQGEGVAWLGPPISAIHDMGDKIQSKVIAAAAGVSIIPGYDGTINSLEHAYEVANQVGYPVLVKAAAGGGGKGMRTCYNDKEIKEAYPMAKSEAKKFFSDDRLLIEKYIENPHHIEFQVLCSPPPGGKLEKPEDLEVVVFPERECSIQRRNQKVIEESPSCLLTEETRLKMAAQTKMLCQKVGYVSAGTVEWLVDENQNFYFLEMNTRLQVEHPITEAITGVDLVKGMLWVAAGLGLPEEFKKSTPIMPFKGHAVEARIYAEDPLRGYLPSTGPLVPYVEPIATGKGDSDLRMDSGVAHGHVVTPFYDPLLSKIIAYAQTRQEAIDILADGLDNYVIEGVQHNARLVNAVLRHKSFRDGDTPTSFLPQHIPVFYGVQLTDSQEEEFAVAVALTGLHRTSHLQQPPIVEAGAPVIVRLGGMFGSAYRVTVEANSAKVECLTDEVTAPVRTVAFDAVEYEPERYVAHIVMDGVQRTVQVNCYCFDSDLVFGQSSLTQHFFVFLGIERKQLWRNQDANVWC